LGRKKNLLVLPCGNNGEEGASFTGFPQGSIGLMALHLLWIAL
jgi:hypothetical protein